MVKIIQWITASELICSYHQERPPAAIEGIPRLDPSAAIEADASYTVMG